MFHRMTFLLRNSQFLTTSITMPSSVSDNLTEEEIVERVDNVLKNLGLYEIRNMKVGSPLNKKISGGQRKRLNISLELIREPAILFLDEPTSGLSSRDSENILDLLKELVAERQAAVHCYPSAIL